MREIVRELLGFAYSILFRWINLVGGALIGFLEMVYRGNPPNWATPSILLVCFVLASFLAWQAERRKALARDRRATLYKIRDLIQDSAGKTNGHYDSFGALLKYSDELGTEEDVIWICDALRAGGHQHPFEMLDKIAPTAFDGQKLTFLQEARAANIDIKRIVSALSFATKRWSRRELYLKEHRKYAGWGEPGQV